LRRSKPWACCPKCRANVKNIGLTGHACDSAHASAGDRGAKAAEAQVAERVTTSLRGHRLFALISRTSSTALRECRNNEQRRGSSECDAQSNCQRQT
jgi:hypothetical protein